MPEYLNTIRTGPDSTVGKSRVENGSYITDWTTFAIPLSGDVSDAANHHNAVQNFGHGARFCHGILDFQLIGGDLGEEIQIRTYEVDGSGARVETHKPHEFYLGTNPIPVNENGDPEYVKSTHQRYPIQSFINSGHYLRAEITAWGSLLKPVLLRYVQFVGYYWS